MFSLLPLAMTLFCSGPRQRIGQGALVSYHGWSHTTAGLIPRAWWTIRTNHLHGPSAGSVSAEPWSPPELSRARAARSRRHRQGHPSYTVLPWGSLPRSACVHYPSGRLCLLEGVFRSGASKFSRQAAQVYASTTDTYSSHGFHCACPHSRPVSLQLRRFCQPPKLATGGMTPPGLSQPQGALHPL